MALNGNLARRKCMPLSPLNREVMTSTLINPRTYKGTVDGGWIAKYLLGDLILPLPVVDRPEFLPPSDDK